MPSNAIHPAHQPGNVIVDIIARPTNHVAAALPHALHGAKPRPAQRAQPGKGVGVGVPSGVAEREDFVAEELVRAGRVGPG